MANLKHHPNMWLRDDAAAAINAYEDDHGVLTINSAGRSIAEQNEAIRRWDKGGASNRPPHLYPPARPAEASNHVANGGVAVDVGNIEKFKKHAAAYGFQWFGLSDPVHFTFTGVPGKVEQVVKDRQNWLNTARGERLMVDGLDGPATKAAIKRYQTFLGVTADGIWGTNTQNAHQAYWNAVNAVPAPGRGVVRRGNTGTNVQDLQNRLRSSYPLYASKLVADGNFGPATEAAVKEFQRRSGLAVDGIVGTQTWKALGL
jgi:hypothetical protein